MYYLRTKAAVDPIKFTLNQEKLKAQKAKVGQLANTAVNLAEADPNEGQACSLDDPDCLMCGS